MNEPLPEDLKNKIENARRLAGRPLQNRFGDCHTIRALLDRQANQFAGSCYLTYLAEDGSARSYSYAQFHQRISAIAAVLSRLGIQRGDRIATAMHNHDATILINFSAWYLGISVAPLNMGEEDKRLAYVLEHSGAKALFVLDEFAERMRPLAKAAANIGHLICADSSQRREGFQSLPALLAAHTSLLHPLPPVEPDDEALVVYTSGTTGVPKGVALSQYNLVADSYAISSWHNLGPQTRMMCVLPVHHVNGLVVTHVTPFYCGASVVLNRKFGAKSFFETAGQHGIHIASVVPTLLQFLLEATPKDMDTRRLAPALKYLVCGAGPLTVDLAARFEERFQIPVCHGYGLSESTCYSCFIPPADSPNDNSHRHWMRDFGFPSIGIPVQTNEMAIHDDNGIEQAEGTKGEIVIRGHNVMLGYHNNLKANQAAFTHGWFRSGDEGFFKTGPDGNRYFFISGRFKELIIRGGVKISPLEIDEALNGIAGVKAAMAVGFENTTYGEEVGAYVVKLPGAEVAEEAILTACRAKMPYWMSPKAVVFGDTFPVTSTGKYQRNQLKPLFSKYRDTQFRDK